MFPSCTGSGPADCNAVSGLIKLVVFGLLICWKIDKPRDFFFHFFFFLSFFFLLFCLSCFCLTSLTNYFSSCWQWQWHWNSKPQLILARDSFTLRGLYRGLQSHSEWDVLVIGLELCHWGAMKPLPTGREESYPQGRTEGMQAVISLPKYLSCFPK